MDRGSNKVPFVLPGLCILVAFWKIESVAFIDVALPLPRYIQLEQYFNPNISAKRVVKMCQLHMARV